MIYDIISPLYSLLGILSFLNIPSMMCKEDFEPWLAHTWRTVGIITGVLMALRGELHMPTAIMVYMIIGTLLQKRAQKRSS